MSCVGKVWTSPLTSKRRTACVPPKYLPCSTRPSFSSSVSAKPVPASSSTALAASKALDKFFMVNSLLPSDPINLTRSNTSRHEKLHDSALLDEPMSKTGCAKCDLLRRPIQFAADVAYESRALLGVGKSANHDHEHIRPLGEDDRGIVVDPRDFAGLVRYGDSRRQPSGNSFVKPLPFEDPDHGPGTLSVHGLSVGDRLHQGRQPACGRGIV